jgi:hypothetical protein
LSWIAPERPDLDRFHPRNRQKTGFLSPEMDLADVDHRIRQN